MTAKELLAELCEKNKGNLSFAFLEPVTHKGRTYVAFGYNRSIDESVVISPNVTDDGEKHLPVACLTEKESKKVLYNFFRDYYDALRKAKDVYVAEGRFNEWVKKMQQVYENILEFTVYE